MLTITAGGCRCFTLDFLFVIHLNDGIFHMEKYAIVYLKHVASQCWWISVVAAHPDVGLWNTSEVVFRACEVKLLSSVILIGRQSLEIHWFDLNWVSDLRLNPPHVHAGC